MDHGFLGMMAKKCGEPGFRSHSSVSLPASRPALYQPKGLNPEVGGDPQSFQVGIQAQIEVWAQSKTVVSG